MEVEEGDRGSEYPGGLAVVVEEARLASAASAALTVDAGCTRRSPRRSPLRTCPSARPPHSGRQRGTAVGSQVVGEAATRVVHTAMEGGAVGQRAVEETARVVAGLAAGHTCQWLVACMHHRSTPRSSPVRCHPQSRCRVRARRERSLHTTSRPRQPQLDCLLRMSQILGSSVGLRRNHRPCQRRQR